MPHLFLRWTVWRSLALAASLPLLLLACGGGQQPPQSGRADTTAPTITAATLDAYTDPSSAWVTVSQASDDSAVVAYCAVPASSGIPSAGNACFDYSPTLPLRLQVNPSTLGTSATLNVFARDAAGNVSSAFAVPLNRCSDANIAAAHASSYAAVVCMGVGAINGSHSGELLIGLDTTAAPLSSANFLQYVADGFYTATVFHRVLSTFMVQAGGRTFASSAYSDKTTGLRSAIALERTSLTGLRNTRYTVALARTSAPDSATSQFFINVVDNPALDASGTTDPGNGYAAFGKVIAGTDTVDAIKAVPVAAASGNSEVSQPTGTPPTILWAVRVK